ncbi:MAG: lyase family protein, partial [Candidatus Magasanikbacteria bacterium]|nr:lyase family protein [Candidatus Magasanikbacteria bacterium]
MNSLTTLSPLDGRYSSSIAELAPYFSELALIKYRVQVEVEYFIALSLEKKIKEIPAFSADLQKKLRAIYQNFSLSDGEAVKLIEKTTNHDVKAVEYFLKEKISKLPCAKYSEFIHFALTSEDINNLSFSLMLKDGLEEVVLIEIQKIIKTLTTLAKQNKSVGLLALTHGQPATPTTLGKELAVFVSRLQYNFNNLKNLKLEGKLNGATGNYAAVQVAYAEIDWIAFGKKFISSLGLKPNLLTTQIESHESTALA